MSAGPWINRRKTLRAQALKRHPGCTVNWFAGHLHFTKLVDGKYVAADRVPGIDAVPKGPHVPSEHKQKRQQARRADQRNGVKLAAQ